MYFYHCVRVCVCVRASPQAAIRKELNEFKSREMEVHEDSKQFTRYSSGRSPRLISNLSQLLLFISSH